MIPHIEFSLKRERARQRPPSGLAELSFYERGDASTHYLCIFGIFRLGQDADDRFGARRPNEHAAAVSQPCGNTTDLVENRPRELVPGNSHVLLHLRIERHHRGRFAERPPLNRTAEEESGREPIT